MAKDRKQYLKEYKQTDKYKQKQKQYRKTQAYKLSRKKYQKTTKWKNAQDRYRRSIKFKKYRKFGRYSTIQKKYRSSPKYKLTRKRYHQSIVGKQTRVKWNNTLKGKLNSINKRMKRLERLNSCIHSFTSNEWVVKRKLTNGVCLGFKCESHYVGDNKLTMDHIYPISKANEDFKRTGVKRTYTIDDVQSLCRSCNASKNDIEPKPKGLNTHHS